MQRLGEGLQTIVVDRLKGKNREVRKMVRQMMCRGKEKKVCEKCELHRVHDEKSHCELFRYCYDTSATVQCEEVLFC